MGSPPLPLSSIPYHHMGLSQEDVNSMDQYYKELRDLKDKTMQKNNDVREAYKKVRQQYKTSAQENLRIGSLKPLEELLPSEKREEGVVGTTRSKPALRQTQQIAEPLAQKDCDAIDKLFKGFDEKPHDAAVETSEGKSHRREQFKKGNEQLEKAKISAASKPEEKKAIQIEKPKAENKIEKFRQMLLGDDGKQVNSNDLDAAGKRLLEAVNAYDQATANKNSRGMSDAEQKLEEFEDLIF